MNPLVLLAVLALVLIGVLLGAALMAWRVFSPALLRSRHQATRYRQSVGPWGGMQGAAVHAQENGR